MNLKEKLNIDAINLNTVSVVTASAVVVLFVLLITACIIFGPLVVIWSINTLLPVAAIPYNFFTWFAVVVLFLLSKFSVSVKK